MRYFHFPLRAALACDGLRVPRPAHIAPYSHLVDANT
jgi:hypothetical protein